MIDNPVDVYNTNSHTVLHSCVAIVKKRKHDTKVEKLSTTSTTQIRAFEKKMQFMC